MPGMTENIRRGARFRPLIAVVLALWLGPPSYVSASALEALNGRDEPQTRTGEERATRDDAPNAEASNAARNEPAAIVPDPKRVGGEPDGIVQVANLVYAGVKSSRCFADHFLVRAEKESTISTSRRFHAVKLGSQELFEFPLVIMTGEGDFTLPDAERENLRQYVECGGFLLASAGCSSTDWDRAFRRETARIFPTHPLRPLGMDHPVFQTVYEIKRLTAKHGKPKPLEGISIGGRLGVIYSQDGLNDTSHTSGCCCCGGNELTNAERVNVNILAYALLY